MMRTARLLSGCALGAVLAALASAAAAQSYQGAHTVVAGAAAVSHTPDGGPGLPAQTNVFVTTPEAVIEWRPVDTGGLGAVDFQTIGTQAFFQTTPANPDYTVLNRIIPVDAVASPVASTVAFRGTTTALLVNSPGGNIWFYSPTGIVVGPTARFNVGSLILTTNDIPVIAGGPSSLYGPGGLVQLAGPAGSTGFVDVQAGAQLNATGANAYIALVAPRVVQGGLVQANGQVAYIAAEQVDMTINGGLFDFTLTVGTTDANGVVHTGTTTGPASTSAADLQRISMVALPKNDALTMLLSGSIGYAPAASAFAEGSSVVLAADFATDDPAAVPASQLGSIEFGNVTVRNPLTAYASDAIAIAPNLGTARFEASSTLYAANSIDGTAEASEQVIALADLSLNAGRPGTGGSIGLQALSGAEVRVGGVFALRASSDAADYDTMTPFLDAQGGQVDILADGGTISAPLSFFAAADAQGAFDAAAGGLGTGGTVDVTVANGGIVESSGLSLSAFGLGGLSDGDGGTGTGGTITVTDAGGQLDLGNFFLTAGGSGGDGGFRSGDGAGGNIAIDVFTQAQAWDQLLVDAGGQAGAPLGTGASGNASASTDAISLTVSGSGALDVLDVVALSAGADVGFNGAAGYTGTAGGVELTVSGGGSLTADSIVVSADARFRGDVPASVPTTSAVQSGGTVSVLADGGSITTRFLTASAGAFAREASVSPGTATGGRAEVLSVDGGSILVEDPGGLLGAGMQILANGHGAPGALAADSFGGTARLAVEDGSIAVLGDIEVAADGTIAEVIAATPGSGFDATGGSALVELLAGTLGTGSIEADNLLVSANGDARLLVVGGAPGGEPIAGDGGDGTGGLASVTANAGGLTTGRLTLESAGIGGTSAASAGATPFTSGNGLAGSSLYAQSAGLATIGTLELLANGTGGGGAPDAAGSDLAALAGSGTGGIAALDMIGGIVDALDTTIEASGTGAAGMSHTGSGDATDGGFGTGGTAALRSPAGGSGSFTSSATLAIRSNGFGGVGGTSAGGTQGDGGDGTGFSAAAALADGSIFLGDVIVEASGTGGNGAFGGGTGTGGQATFALVDTSGPSGVRQLEGLTVEANGNPGLTTGGFPDQSEAGDVLLDVRVFDAASALTVNGNVVLNSRGGVIGAPSGVTIAVAGAPLRIGGTFTVEAGDIAIDADAPLLAAADAFLSAERTYVSTGLVGSDSALTVQAGLGTTAERLSSGGTAFLSGVSGPLLVADLASAGEVTAFGSSVDIRSLGTLQFASATATAGDLYIETFGDLGIAGASASGWLALESSAGSITGGDLTAGTWSYVDAFGSASLGNIAAGTDAAVTTRGGDLTVSNVTAGDEIWLSIFGTDITRVLTAGNLVTTGLGADGAAGPPELFGGPGPTGNVTRLRSSGSLVMGDMQSPGRAILVADAGTTTAGDLGATEALILLGRGNMALDSIATDGRFYVADSAMFLPNLPEAYDPASLDGLTPLRTSGGLTIGSAVEAGDITVAVAGAATAPSWTSAGGLLIDAGGQFVSSNTVSAGGNVSVTADDGIDLAALTSGGTTVLRSPLGTVVVDNLLSAGAVTARGRSVDIASTGALSFADLDATAGNLLVATTGNLALTTADATGTMTLSSSTGSLAAIGPVSAGGAVSATAPAGVSLAALASGGTTQLTSADGAIGVETLVSPGLVSVMGRGVDIDGSGPLSFSTAISTGPMSITASDDLAFASVNAALDLTLTSTAGSLTATGNVSGGFTQLDAGNDIEIAGNLNSGGTLVATAGGAFSVTGAASTDDANITADQGITLTSLSSGEITRLEAANGNVLVGELLTGGRVTARGSDVNITSSGSLQFDDARAFLEDVRIQTAGGLTVAGTFASNEIVLDSGGTFTLLGDARGLSIDVTSSDIVLEAGARLGLQDATRDLTLRNGDSESETFIGGEAQAGDYSLDRNEAARLFVDETITVLADGDITIGDLAMSFGPGGTNIGAGGMLEISTPEEVNIVGDVALRTSGADDTFRIDPRLIALRTDTGSISMFTGEGGGGTPQGRLELVGDRIVAATAANIDQLETLTDLDAISELLGEPGGTGEPLSAGTIHIDVMESLFIQNSGASNAFADRRGFAASGLEITTESSAAQIAINGRINTPSGAVTGLEVTPLVEINGVPAAAGGQFHARSTINGCVIGQNCAPREPDLPELDLPTREDVESPVIDEGGGPLFVAPLIELAGTDPLITPPLVDEPITGVGNDDLWEPRCEPDEESEPCSEEDGRP